MKRKWEMRNPEEREKGCKGSTFPIRSGDLPFCLDGTEKLYRREIAHCCLILEHSETVLLSGAGWKSMRCGGGSQAT